MAGKPEVGHILDATIPPQEHMTLFAPDGAECDLYFYEFTFSGRKLIIVRERPITDKWMSDIRPYLKKQFPVRED